MPTLFSLVYLPNAYRLSVCIFHTVRENRALKNRESRGGGKNSPGAPKLSMKPLGTILSMFLKNEKKNQYNDIKDRGFVFFFSICIFLSGRGQVDYIKLK